MPKNCHKKICEVHRVNGVPLHVTLLGRAQSEQTSTPCLVPTCHLLQLPLTPQPPPVLTLSDTKIHEGCCAYEVFLFSLLTIIPLRFFSLLKLDL